MKSQPMQLAEDGFFIVPGVLTGQQAEEAVRALEKAFADDRSDSTLRSGGGVYGARNLLRLWPAVADICKRSNIPGILAESLGERFGLVRALYFDKPPEQSSALPWHQDLAIAVKDNRLSSEHFSRPTNKAGVPHVNAPVWLLEQMLTLRIHLDEATAENGPLQVLPGSHRGNSQSAPLAILAACGDALIMRPLLSHCSNRSQPGTTLHRRVLHYEFAAIEKLPDGYEWHDFLPLP